MTPAMVDVQNSLNPRGVVHDCLPPAQGRAWPREQRADAIHIRAFDRFLVRFRR